jgi:hypothetical protein|tara:strand:+ start:4458 stop:5027 length:570 start_codon:yes stop_codon:yes gene_type:complete
LLSNITGYQNSRILLSSRGVSNELSSQNTRRIPGRTFRLTAAALVATLSTSVFTTNLSSATTRVSFESVTARVRVVLAVDRVRTFPSSLPRPTLSLRALSPARAPVDVGARIARIFTVPRPRSLVRARRTTRMRSLDSFGYAIHDRDARDAKRARASRRRASRVGYPERRRLRATARRPGARAGVRDGV